MSAIDFAELCNGSTADSDSVCLGSNPSSAASSLTLHPIRAFSVVLEARFLYPRDGGGTSKPDLLSPRIRQIALPQLFQEGINMYTLESKYRSMGGWLLFFVIAQGIGLLSASVSLMDSQYFAMFGLVRDYPDLLSILWIGIISSGLDIVLAGVVLVLIFMRRPVFRKIFFLRSITQIAPYVVLIILVQTSSWMPKGMMPTIILQAIAAVISFLIWFSYFSKSLRVKIYLGEITSLDPPPQPQYVPPQYVHPQPPEPGESLPDGKDDTPSE